MSDEDFIRISFGTSSHEEEEESLSEINIDASTLRLPTALYSSSIITQLGHVQDPLPLLKIDIDDVLSLENAANTAKPTKIYLAFAMHTNWTSCRPYLAHFIMVNDDNTFQRFGYDLFTSHTLESHITDTTNYHTVLLTTGDSQCLAFFEKHLDLKKQCRIFSWKERLCSCAVSTSSDMVPITTEFQYIAQLLNHYTPIRVGTVHTVEQLYDSLKRVIPKK